MFYKNFNKAGPGIDKDAPQKQGSLFFLDILAREGWTLVILNLLFILSCLPIITIGPSICAMNYICAKMLRDEPIDLFSDYKYAFMLNIGQGILISCIVGLVSFSLVYAYLFYSAIIGYASYVILLILLIFAIVNVYLFPLASLVKLKTKDVFKNSLLLSLMCVKPTLCAFIANFLITIINLAIYPVCFIYYAIIGVSYSVLLNLFFAYPQIKKYALEQTNTEALENNNTILNLD